MSGLDTSSGKAASDSGQENIKSKSKSTDELLLIEHAHLARSAADTLPRSVCTSEDDSTTTAVDEDTLIVSSVLVKSESGTSKNVCSELLDELLASCTEKGHAVDELSYGQVQNIANNKQTKENSGGKSPLGDNAFDSLVDMSEARSGKTSTVKYDESCNETDDELVLDPHQSRQPQVSVKYKTEKMPKNTRDTTKTETGSKFREMSPIPRLDIADIYQNQKKDIPYMDVCVKPTNFELNEDKEKEEEEEEEEKEEEGQQQVTVRNVIKNKPVLQRKSMEDTPTYIDFNSLIIDISNAISAVELGMIKTMFRDMDCVARECITAKIDSPLLYLNLLRKYRLVSRDNLCHVQAIILKLNKPSLHDRAVQYAKHNLQIVYFYPPPENIPSNYGLAKCHVEGKDFTRLKRTDLENIRSKMSALLFVPAHLVYIVGIEPGLSVIITLMLPKCYMDLLVKMTAEGIPELVISGIDALNIDGKTYNLSVVDNSNLHAVEDHMKFLTVFHQLRDKNRTLEEKDLEIERLNRDADLMKLELDTMSSELELLTETAVKRYIGRQPIRKKHWRTSSLPPLRYVSRQDEYDSNEYSRSCLLPSLPVSYTDSTGDDVGSPFSVQDRKHDTTEEGIRKAEQKFETDRDELMSEIEQLLSELGAS